MFDITACIVLYKNDPKMLKDAISSFLNTSLNVKIYLIDNSPTDELKFLRSEERIEYHFNDNNMGFGSAHNVIIKKAQLEGTNYHLVLNPDVYFERGELEKQYSFLQQNQDIGLLMPKVLYPDSEIQYLCKRNPKPFDLFARRFLPDFIKKKMSKRMGLYEYKDHNYNEIIYDVPYLSGCYMLFRMDILARLNGFDERIFMYIEDADISRRALEISRTVYYPGSTIFHHYGKGSYKNFKLMYYNIHGAFIYFNKWGWI